MPSQTNETLETARQYLLQYQFQKAYNAYRRHFDRLPFAPEASHAEHFASFTRTVMELGKLDQLRFYVPILEERYREKKCPYMGYVLASLIDDLEIPPRDRAKEIVRDVLTNPRTDLNLKIKAKILLARLHYGNPLEVIQIIKSIREIPSDPVLRTVLKIWDAIILRHQGKLIESLACLEGVLASPDLNWYTQFSANCSRVRTLLELDEFQEAQLGLESLESAVKLIQGKTAQRDFNELKKSFLNRLKTQSVELDQNKKSTLLRYREHVVSVIEPVMAKILELFAQGRKVGPTQIERRGYTDPSILEKSILGIRRKLVRLELPSESIQRNGRSFHLIPQLIRRGST